MFSTANTLVNVAQYQADIADFLRQQDDDERDLEQSGIYKELMTPSVDLDVSDCQVRTLFERVENLIQQIKHRPSTEDQEEIKRLQELVNAPKPETITKKKKAHKEKRKLKDVNYITESMKVRHLNAPFEQIDPAEVLIHVTICHPVRQLKLQDFYVLGSQFLYELRDRISCLSDELPPEHVRCPASFFFIENIFYDDVRHPSSSEHSGIIIDWVMQNHRYVQADLGVFKSSSMLTTRFRDLTLRVGAPYLYRHQGDCDHLLLINEIRAVHEQDCQNKASYPIQTFQAKRFKRKCQVCNIYPSKFVTYNDPLAVDSPCFFCQNCYQPFHYTANGTPIYDYNIFEYHYE